jgi:ATP-dependent 26S proteasome regulatory subunit
MNSDTYLDSEDFNSWIKDYKNKYKNKKIQPDKNIFMKTTEEYKSSETESTSKKSIFRPRRSRYKNDINKNQINRTQINRTQIKTQPNRAPVNKEITLEFLNSILPDYDQDSMTEEMINQLNQDKRQMVKEFVKQIDNSHKDIGVTESTEHPRGKFNRRVLRYLRR